MDGPVVALAPSQRLLPMGRLQDLVAGPWARGVSINEKYLDTISAVPKALGRERLADGAEQDIR